MLNKTTDGIRLKRVARNLYYRKRHLAATGHEQTEGKELKRGIQVLMVMIERSKRAAKFERGREVKERGRERRLAKMTTYLRMLIAQYLVLNVEDPDDLPPQPSRRCRIEDFHPTVCKTFFRFRREGLYKLYALLRIPEVVKFKNRSKMSGEEVFLRGLFELCTGSNQEIACITIFGGVQSDQSRAFSYFVTHMWDEHKHLVHDNLEWWFGTGYMTKSAELISAKMGISTTVCCFIDCNCLTTDTPGGGPAEEGANALRWNDMVQRAFYNGWKSTHGRHKQACMFYDI
jgi:Fe-S-cluster containining protein